MLNIIRGGLTYGWVGVGVGASPVKITIKRYAVSGGGRVIERVDVSVDGGKSLGEASRFQKSGSSYIADDDSKSEQIGHSNMQLHFYRAEEAYVLAVALLAVYITLTVE
ncbi:hypothetical protein AgCh_030667 [Apium graveolens]